ncbi:2-dehydropantoate 2-reductase [Rhodococcus opacus PD630]|uniref:ketopantoate reductase family protein n=1 Tax=Rhodococcus opacus TaxID=37919 RepID=UPI00029CC751|nr:2-dehydropantoate 2-reductase [Rhodococcus opacus]EHI43624.1 2-dehydropantoate 2-reductase [Rhodococcus opacus PD630]UDH01251.1 2-dehydropantoate 2-reductase [Rhodococcus opacus PD630]
MRYVIYGAGAIGGVIGGRLHQSGHDVVLIARGAHLEALRTDGLRIQSARDDVRLSIPAVSTPAEANITSGDVVILAMKAQDTTAAVAELASVAPHDIVVLCAQNGVDNERIALRSFAHVYGLYVFVVATHLAPGTVQYFTDPSCGILDIGRYPSGRDDVADRLSDEFQNAGFDSRSQPGIMQWKYRKLLSNLANALQALCEEDGDLGLERLTDLAEGVFTEAAACYKAAGIDCVTASDQDERIASLMPFANVDGHAFPGGSSWQSLARGSGRIETDYLNGEVVLLGREFGVPTPVNEVLQRTARRMARTGLAPGSVTPDQLRAEVQSAKNAVVLA